MEMLSHLMVVVKILVEINFAIVIGVMQASDLVAAADINGLVDNLQPQRLEHPRGNATPGELALRQIQPFNDPHIPLPRTHRSAAVVFEEIEPAQAHPRFPRIIIRQLEGIGGVRPQVESGLNLRLHRLGPLRLTALRQLDQVRGSILGLRCGHDFGEVLHLCRRAGPN